MRGQILELLWCKNYNIDVPTVTGWSRFRRKTEITALWFICLLCCPLQFCVQWPSLSSVSKGVVNSPWKEPEYILFLRTCLCCMDEGHILNLLISRLKVAGRAVLLGSSLRLQMLFSYYLRLICFCFSVEWISCSAVIYSGKNSIHSQVNVYVPRCNNR